MVTLDLPVKNLYHTTIKHKKITAMRIPSGMKKTLGSIVCLKLYDLFVSTLRSIPNCCSYRCPHLLHFLMGGTDIDIFLQMTSKLDCLFLSVGEKAKREAQQGSQKKVSREGEEECNGRNEHSKRNSNCEENEHFLSCSSRTNRISNRTDPPFCISFFIKTPSQYKLASLCKERVEIQEGVAVEPMHVCIALSTF